MHLDGALTGSCQVSAVESARSLLGLVARGEEVPAAAFREFAQAVLAAMPIAWRTRQVQADDQPHRLARAIELAGAVLDAHATRHVPQPARRPGSSADPNQSRTHRGLGLEPRARLGA